MIRTFIKISIAVVAIFTIGEASAQDRAYIRQKIEAAGGNCYNVAITETSGDVALLGDTTYVVRGIPRSLTLALKEVKDGGNPITDVCLTEEGRWVVLYSSNGVIPHGVPTDMEEALRQYNAGGSRITSASFTDSGRWVIATSDEFSAYDATLTKWLNDGMDEYGVPWSACITDSGVVACYSGGVRYQGEIPATLKEAIDKATIDIYRLKISGQAWFFADKKGMINYSM